MSTVFPRRQQPRPIPFVIRTLLPFLMLALQISLPGALPAQESLGAPLDLDQIGAGTLVFRSEAPGTYLPAPIVDSRVELKVTAIIGRATVVQRFFNPTDDWLEGLYVFPLPDNAAVDTLRMVIGERVIEGQVREKAQARATYVQARSEGRRAALVEQQRPNVFTAAVANVGPGEVVEIHLEYQHEVSYVDGAFSLRFPTVVAPRYDAARGVRNQLEVVAASASAGSADVVVVPVLASFAADGDTEAADRYESHSTLGPSPGPEVEIVVDLEPGVPLERIDSPSHSIVTHFHGDGRAASYTVNLADGRVAADRDFVLEWRPIVGEEPQAALFSETIDGQTYVLLMLVPPAEAVDGVRLPREIVFVIDTSGSMAGRALKEAKEALRVGLGRLAAGDLFNIIEFNSVASRLFPASVVADRANLDLAEAFVDDLEADGGTEMLWALKAALGDPADGVAAEDSGPTGWLRQVVFLTDGAVDNEDQLLTAIDDSLGASRLFTIGIGSAPNSWFMRKAAERGRGTYTFIASVAEVAEKTGDLLSRLETPTLRDVEVLWDDPTVEMWPRRVPDLYAGEPIIVAARLGQPGLGALVQGRRGHLGVTEVWEEALPLAAGRRGAGIDRLWARRKISSLMDSLREGADADGVRAAVVELGLNHRLVSRYTSLVAVDVTPSAPAGVARSGNVSLHLPAGSDPTRMLGVLPQGGTSARLLFVLGLLALIGAMLTTWHRSQAPRQ